MVGLVYNAAVDRDRLLDLVDRALGDLSVDRASPTLVACSGGADSASLGHLAARLAAAGRLGPVTLCYIDHQLRAGSAADGDVVRALAAGCGAGFATAAVDVDRRTGSLEAAARDARYAALDRIATELGAATILVAHTSSDQVETVLMRLLRGTGVVGLGGIPPRRGRIARPLLGAARDEVEAYCREQGIAPVEDPMNLDPRHLRVRVRRVILPALRRESPGVDAALLSLSSSARDAASVLDRAAQKLLAAASTADGLAVAPLAASAPAVLAHALARAVADAGGGPLGARHHVQLAALVHRPAGGSARADLPGLTAWREYDRLRLDPSAVPPPPCSIEVNGPDRPYCVRHWRAGDRMRPVRLAGRSRKLSDLFTDARVPRRVRAAAQVVVRSSDGEIVWAEHIGPAFGVEVHVTLTHRESMATNKSR